MITCEWLQTLRRRIDVLLLVKNILKKTFQERKLKYFKSSKKKRVIAYVEK